MTTALRYLVRFAPLIVCLAPCFAADPSVVFLKQHWFLNDGPGNIVEDTLDAPWQFLATIIGPGNVTAYVTPPNLKVAPMTYNAGLDYVYLLKNFPDQASLDSAYGDGVYRVSGAGKTAQADLAGGLYPDAPVITVSAYTLVAQNGGTQTPAPDPSWSNSVLIRDTSRGLKLTARYNGAFTPGQTSITVQLYTMIGGVLGGGTPNLASNTSSPDSREVTLDLPPGATTGNGPGVIIRTTVRNTVASTSDAGIPVTTAYESVTQTYINYNTYTGTPPRILVQPQDQSIVAGGTASFSVGASGTNLRYQWMRNGAISGATSSSYTTPALSQGQNPSYTVRVSNNIAFVDSDIVFVTVAPAPVKPSVSLLTPTIVIYPGNTAIFTVNVNGTPPFRYQWNFNGTPLATAPDSPRFVVTASAATTGTYSCTVTNAAGSTTSSDGTLRFAQSAPAFRFVNLSVRGTLVANGSPLIIGYYISPGDNAHPTLPLLIRATGPALTTYGVDDPLPDPTVDIHGTVRGADAIVAANNNWGATSANLKLVQDTNPTVGAFPLTDPSSTDAALVTSLAPGAYSAIVSDRGGAAGTTLGELYDTNSTIQNTGVVVPHLSNISCLSRVPTGGTLTAGFFTSGVSRALLIRATGPGLRAFGINDAMPDPQLTLHFSANGKDTILGQNNAWAGDDVLNAVASSVGAFTVADLKSSDAVLVIMASPGSYSAVVSSTTSTAGRVLLEVYEVP